MRPSSARVRRLRTGGSSPRVAAIFLRAKVRAAVDSSSHPICPRAAEMAFETELLGDGPARGALLGETGAGQGGGIGIVIDETGRLEAVENLLGDAGVGLPALQEIGQSRARGG